HTREYVYSLACCEFCAVLMLTGDSIAQVPTTTPVSITPIVKKMCDEICLCVRECVKGEKAKQKVCEVIHKNIHKYTSTKVHRDSINSQNDALSMHLISTPSDISIWTNDVVDYISQCLSRIRPILDQRLEALKQTREKKIADPAVKVDTAFATSSLRAYITLACFTESIAILFDMIRARLGCQIGCGIDSIASKAILELLEDCLDMMSMGKDIQRIERSLEASNTKPSEPSVTSASESTADKPPTTPQPNPTGPLDVLLARDISTWSDCWDSLHRMLVSSHKLRTTLECIVSIGSVWGGGEADRFSVIVSKRSVVRDNVTILDEEGEEIEEEEESGSILSSTEDIILPSDGSLVMGVDIPMFVSNPPPFAPLSLTTPSEIRRKMSGRVGAEDAFDEVDEDSSYMLDGDEESEGEGWGDKDTPISLYTHTHARGRLLLPFLPWCAEYICVARCPPPSVCNYTCGGVFHARSDKKTRAQGLSGVFGDVSGWSVGRMRCEVDLNSMNIFHVLPSRLPSQFQETILKIYTKAIDQRRSALKKLPAQPLKSGLYVMCVYYDSERHSIITQTQTKLPPAVRVCDLASCPVSFNTDDREWISCRMLKDSASGRGSGEKRGVRQGKIEPDGRDLKDMICKAVRKLSSIVSLPVPQLGDCNGVIHTLNTIKVERNGSSSSSSSTSPDPAPPLQPKSTPLSVFHSSSTSPSPLFPLSSRTACSLFTGTEVRESAENHDQCDDLTSTVRPLIPALKSETVRVILIVRPVFERLPPQNMGKLSGITHRDMLRVESEFLEQQMYFPKTASLLSLSSNSEMGMRWIGGSVESDCVRRIVTHVNCDDSSLSLLPTDKRIVSKSLKYVPPRLKKSIGLRTGSTVIRVLCMYHDIDGDYVLTNSVHSFCLPTIQLMSRCLSNGERRVIGTAKMFNSVQGVDVFCQKGHGGDNNSTKDEEEEEKPAILVSIMDSLATLSAELSVSLSLKNLYDVGLCVAMDDEKGRNDVIYAYIRAPHPHLFDHTHLRFVWTPFPSFLHSLRLASTPIRYTQFSATVMARESEIERLLDTIAKVEKDEERLRDRFDEMSEEQQKRKPFKSKLLALNSQLSRVYFQMGALKAVHNTLTPVWMVLSWGMNGAKSPLNLLTPIELDEYDFVTCARVAAALDMAFCGGYNVLMASVSWRGALMGQTERNRWLIRCQAERTNVEVVSKFRRGVRESYQLHCVKDEEEQTKKLRAWFIEQKEEEERLSKEKEKHMALLREKKGEALSAKDIEALEQLDKNTSTPRKAPEFPIIDQTILTNLLISPSLPPVIEGNDPSSKPSPLCSTYPPLLHAGTLYDVSTGIACLNMWEKDLETVKSGDGSEATSSTSLVSLSSISLVSTELLRSGEKRFYEQDEWVASMMSAEASRKAREEEVEERRLKWESEARREGEDEFDDRSLVASPSVPLPTSPLAQSGMQQSGLVSLIVGDEEDFVVPILPIESKAPSTSTPFPAVTNAHPDVSLIHLLPPSHSLREREQIQHYLKCMAVEIVMDSVDKSIATELCTGVNAVMKEMIDEVLKIETERKRQEYLTQMKGPLQQIAEERKLLELSKEEMERKGLLSAALALTGSDGLVASGGDPCKQQTKGKGKNLKIVVETPEHEKFGTQVAGGEIITPYTIPIRRAVSQFACILRCADHVLNCLDAGASINQCVDDCEDKCDQSESRMKRAIRLVEKKKLLLQEAEQYEVGQIEIEKEKKRIRKLELKQIKQMKRTMRQQQMGKSILVPPVQKSPLCRSRSRDGLSKTIGGRIQQSQRTPSKEAPSAMFSATHSSITSQPALESSALASGTTMKPKSRLAVSSGVPLSTPTFSLSLMSPVPSSTSANNATVSTPILVSRGPSEDTKMYIAGQALSSTPKSKKPVVKKKKKPVSMIERSFVRQEHALAERRIAHRYEMIKHAQRMRKGE
ncbi:hypothetical protein ADUPG1_006001, partial [Aduncisulcus paluster]